MNRPEVITADCRAALAQMPAGAFDCVVTDPPYGQTNERYDGPNAVSLDPAVWRECFRVCADNAALVSFAGGPTYHRIATAIEAGGWKVRQMWGWVYRDGMITSAWPKEGFDRLAPAMDPIVFATKGKVLLNVEREGAAKWHRERNTPRSMACISERSGGCRATAAVGRYPRTLVSDGCEPFEYFAFPRARKTTGSGHPNEKPVELMRWLIAKLPGLRVLDPFAGSGTTLVAAALEGRSATGVEMDAGHCDIIRRRLAAVDKDAGLFAEAE